MIGQRIASIQNGIYLFPEFLPEALCCFSTREFDASEDIPRFLKAIGIREDHFSTVEQVHGNEVVMVSSPSFPPLPEADGMITGEKDLALVIRTADCVPLFFLDTQTPAVGMCHAGWRGTRKGIVSRMVEMFQKSFGSSPSFLRVGIGPCIRESCYEVGGEFEGYFPGWVRRREEKFLFDLTGAVKDQLERSGVARESIFDSNLCTACSVEQFFSARREGNETGRFLSAIVLK